MPIYMKFEGIDGEITGKYKGYIELESCQISGQSITSQSNRGAAKKDAPKPEIGITKIQDTTSTLLFQLCATGDEKKVKVVFLKNEKEAPYLTVELENTLISSFIMSGRGGDNTAKPIESLSLNYGKIIFTSNLVATP
jgi:type VI protein secretion system component Hcp